MRCLVALKIYVTDIVTDVLGKGIISAEEKISKYEGSYWEFGPWDAKDKTWGLFYNRKTKVY